MGMGKVLDVWKGLKSYRLPGRRAEVLLACEKCQRKQRKGKGELRKFSKLVKEAGREAGGKARVVDLPCLGICPKGGVVVVTASQLQRGEFSVLREASEVNTLVGGLLSAVGERAALKHVQQHEQNNDQQQGADPTCAVVTPGAGVGPGR